MIRLKSPREINAMRAAGRLVWEAHQKVAAAVRPGVTTAAIDQLVEAFFDAQGAEPLFKGYPGATPFPAVTCISVNDEVVHGIPGERVLCEGDIVSVDTGCRVKGWCGDAAATYPVGKIGPAAQALLDTTATALSVAIEALRTCGWWSEIAREIQAHVESRGCSVVTEMVGHGVGRDLHEPPQVPHYYSKQFAREEDFEIRPGLVLAIEPMVTAGGPDLCCLDDGWTQVTLDGSLSAQFEHTVAITQDGPVLLTGPPAPDVFAADSSANGS